MSEGRRYWIWIFGEFVGLRWVIDQDTMAFTDSARRRIPVTTKGDRAALYVSRGAFHRPNRDMTHLAGIVAVDGDLTRVEKFDIHGQAYEWTVPITKEILLPERLGPHVKPLAGSLSFVKRPESWGAYFRKSPIAISGDDFNILSDAVRNFRVEDQQ